MDLLFKYESHIYIANKAMREICIPIPIGSNAEIAEVEVKIGNKNIKIQYR